MFTYYRTLLKPPPSGPCVTGIGRDVTGGAHDSPPAVPGLGARTERDVLEWQPA
jgi:hypothetical protein